MRCAIAKEVSLDRAAVIERDDIDSDAPPPAKAELNRMRRLPLARHLRWKLGLSQAEFSARFHIPLDTLWDWERLGSEPDPAAEAYLKVIAADATFVEWVLVSCVTPYAVRPPVSSC